MSSILTVEEAEEKIAKDLVEKGDLNGAELMRKYQDLIHQRQSAGKESKSPEPPPASKTDN